MKEKSQCGNDDQTTAQSEERSEKPSDERDRADSKNEEQRRHAMTVLIGLEERGAS
jgi:hypothetical protein